MAPLGHRQCGDATTGLARLPDRLRLPIRFDPQALAADLARLRDETWTAHFVTDNYRGDWDILPLRAPAGVTHPILRAASHPGVTDWDDTELLAACPAFAAVLASLRCPIEAARLMRLAPGSEIREHRDPDLAAEWGNVRLHVPVVTHPEVAFYLNGARVDMASGEMWYLRLSDPHRVTNGGPSERVHLVIDVRVNSWLETQLFAADSIRSTA